MEAVLLMGEAVLLIGEAVLLMVDQTITDLKWHYLILSEAGERDGEAMRSAS